jgi:adenylyl cyclase-associated protein
MSKNPNLQPLQDLVDSILSRLDVLESKVGVAPPTKQQKAPAPAAPLPVSPSSVGSSPAVKAYDAFIESSVTPMAEACNALGGMQDMGSLLKESWSSIGTILAVANRAKKPTDVPAELQPLLGKTQASIKQMQSLRLDRAYDDHCKAIMESNAALSWILVAPPPLTPAAFVKEASSSTEFWTNRIRKQYKNQNDAQIAFCDALKKMLADLVTYIQEYHKTGLTWNPKGVSVAEAAIIVEDSARPVSPDSSSVAAGAATPHSPRPFINKVSGGSGGMSSLVAELASKRSADGSSAATGLKHVRIIPKCLFNVQELSLDAVLTTFLGSRTLGDERTANVAKGIQGRKDDYCFD